MEVKFLASLSEMAWTLVVKRARVAAATAAVEKVYRILSLSLCVFGCGCGGWVWDK